MTTDAETFTEWLQALLKNPSAPPPPHLRLRLLEKNDWIVRTENGWRPTATAVSVMKLRK